MSRPVYSTDDTQADKHKMERFLHDGRNSVATVFAPVTYPPQPVLAFDMASGSPKLAFTGAFSSDCLDETSHFTAEPPRRRAASSVSSASQLPLACHQLCRWPTS